MTEIRNLTRNGETFYPLTHVEGVLDPEGEYIGYYTDNPEWIKVILDNDKKVLAGIKVDGSVEWSLGIPQPIKDYIITVLLNKVDKEEDKSLIDSEVASSFNYKENPEFISVELDSDNKILSGRKADGTKFENVGLEITGSSIAGFDDPEARVKIETDFTGKIVSYRDNKGILHENAGIESPSVETNRLNLTKDGLKGLEQALIEDGFNPTDEEAVEGIQANGIALPKNDGVVNIPAASSNNYGLMSPQDKIALGSLQPSINIEGSGVTKNAASFGFLPTATAEENNVAMTNALNGGGTIIVDMPGIYDISEAMVVGSNTTLIFGSNTFVRMNSNRYVVVNEGAYTRTYNENIKLIGLHLITNGYMTPQYTIDEGVGVPSYAVYGLSGLVSFFYVKHLYLCDYKLYDLQTHGYFANICTFEDVVVERCVVYGEKDGLHFGRGKRLVVRDCVFSCYDDACTFNAVDYTMSQPEVGWIEDVLVENCYDLPNPNHASAGYFSRFMGGAWKNWESGQEVMLSSIAIIERNGVKYMYRVAGPWSIGDRGTILGYKFITRTQPSGTVVGGVEYLDEQTVTRNTNGVEETITIKIPWVLQQTQDVGYDGGCRNITVRNINLFKERTFVIQYYMDNLWLNAIVPNAIGTSVFENITFDDVYQKYEGVSEEYKEFLKINAPSKNIKITNCLLKDYTLLNQSKLTIAGLVYPEAVFTIAGNSFANENVLYLASVGNIENKIRLYGNIILNNNVLVRQDGANFIQNDII